MAIGGKKKGAPKTGGRQKGAANKRSLELLKGLMSYGCMPAEQIAALLMSPDLSVFEKLGCWEKMLPYLYSQFKAIDPEGYLSAQQVGGKMASQAIKFQNLLLQYQIDPMVIGAILADLRPKGDGES